jgi:hypothetical protein
MASSETGEAGWEKAGFLGFLCALVTYLLLGMFYMIIVMTDMPRAMMHGHDVHARIVAFASIIGLFLPLICFVRSLVWIFRTFPLPAGLVGRRFMGGCVGGLSGIAGAYAAGAGAHAWYGLGPLTFVAVGLALPPLLCCLGETVATRGAMRPGSGGAPAS